MRVIEVSYKHLPLAACCYFNATCAIMGSLQIMMTCQHVSTLNLLVFSAFISYPTFLAFIWRRNWTTFDQLNCVHRYYHILCSNLCVHLGISHQYCWYLPIYLYSKWWPHSLYTMNKVRLRSTCIPLWITKFVALTFLGTKKLRW